MSRRVYAIVPGRSRVSGAGIDGERLRVVREAPIAAVIGDAPSRRSATPAQLAAYDAVLQRIASQAGSIVPARFATHVTDEEEVRFILRTRRRSLQRTLAQVRHRAQMTVRLVEAPRRREPELKPRVQFRKPTSGTAYLRERAAAAAAMNSVGELASIRGAVQRWIRDERVERHGRLATVYHLIPRGSADAYRRALERAARMHGVPVTISGPWVPYAFATDGARDA